MEITQEHQVVPYLEDKTNLLHKNLHNQFSVGQIMLRVYNNWVYFIQNKANLNKLMNPKDQCYNLQCLAGNLIQM